MPNRKFQSSVFIHPSADIDPRSAIGAGTRVWQFSIVGPGARIGCDCNIGAHCYIEGGVVLGDNVTVKNEVSLWEGIEVSSGVFIGPNAVFTNDLFPRSRRLPEAAPRYREVKGYLQKTRLEYGATIGAGAMIRAGISIGFFATVGLGAVVVSPVPAHSLVVGNPARRIGWVCECGLVLPSTLVCTSCRKKYRRRADALQKAR